MSSATTKGGVQKRVFKPKKSISTTPANTPAQDRTQKAKPYDRETRSRTNRTTPKDNNDRRFNNKEKVIQLEGGFSTGIAATVVHKSIGERPSYDVVRNSMIEKKISKAKEPNSISGNSSGKAHKDDIADSKNDIPNEDEKYLYEEKAFVVDSDEEDSSGSLRLPKGWSAPTSVGVDIKKESASHFPYNYVNDGLNDQGEKILFFQLPDVIMRKATPFNGSVRYYESGRAEIVDSETGRTYDLITGPAMSESSAASPTIHLVKISSKDNSFTHIGNMSDCRPLIAIPRMDSIESTINL